ncbi:MAG: adenylosuccinate synthetase, partial [Candidatus Sericytochromatia bacterium]|nr:adenylosuccinate synthetase [Candidatus Sericytochromatia bacterium]
GIVRGKKCVLGNGVVVNPEFILGEISSLEEKGYSVEGKLFISERAHIITPDHINRDKKQEEFRTKKVGTTGKGIGPCYTDKISRHGIRFIDFVEHPDIIDGYKETLEQLKPYIANTFEMLHEAIDNKENIIFEGAQGTFLDIDHGTYPYVTSSSTTSAGACTGTGIPPTMIDKVVSVLKAYTTRVGFGPFPCEQTNEVGNLLTHVGKEFGTTTGRKRRCGWLDLFMADYSRKINGVNYWVITKLDVLSDFKEICICTGYKYNNKFLLSYPATVNILEGVEPVYKSFKGWQCDISQCTTWDELPKEAKTYLKFIEEFTSTPIAIVSVGAERNQNIILKDVWKD